MEMAVSYRPFKGGRPPVVVLLDQLALPGKVRFVRCRELEGVARAIETMIVRGAPAIGVTAAFGLVLGAFQQAPKNWAKGPPTEAFLRGWERGVQRMKATRPTAVNLFWAIDRMDHRVRSLRALPFDQFFAQLEAEAVAIFHEDIELCRSIGRHGEKIVPPGARILTHCNAGALATAGYGTALGVIRRAFERDQTISVWVDETRPYLQGARLTAWELLREGIDCTLICDNMAGFLMSQGRVDLVVVGADRIARNGDAANKIGSYSLAVLARAHGVPFYVAAPYSTIDPKIASGEAIPIEERSPTEVTHIGFGRKTAIAPEGIKVYNPSFDKIPARLISGIITDRALHKPPFKNLISE